MIRYLARMLFFVIGPCALFFLILLYGASVLFDGLFFKKSGARETDESKRSRELGLPMNKIWQRR